VVIRRVIYIVALAMTCAGSAIAQDAGDVSPSVADTVQALQQRMLADPQLADAVHALSDNPQVQAILADPALAAALSRGDVATLLADPKIKRLADDPAVQSVTRQVAP